MFRGSENDFWCFFELIDTLRGVEPSKDLALQAAMWAIGAIDGLDTVLEAVFVGRCWVGGDGLCLVCVCGCVWYGVGWFYLLFFEVGKLTVVAKIWVCVVCFCGQLVDFLGRLQDDGVLVNSVPEISRHFLGLHPKVKTSKWMWKEASVATDSEFIYVVYVTSSEFLRAFCQDVMFLWLQRRRPLFSHTCAFGRTVMA